MNPDGSDQTIYSRSADAINTHPVWSLDGEVILFTQLDIPGAIPGIAVADYIDGEYSEYRYNIGPIPLREARYSPDGLWLVFESWPTGSNHDIYLLTASGAGRTRLTDDPSLDFDPIWRPAMPTSTP
jgi:Tol biopolymer transport system component